MSDQDDSKRIKQAEKPLNNRERRYVQVYSETGNATKAAEEAYNPSSKRSAASLGSQVLQRPHVQRAIQVRFEEEWPDADRDIVIKLRDIIHDDETATRDVIAAIKELARLRDLYPTQKKASVNVNLSDKFKLPGGD